MSFVGVLIYAAMAVTLGVELYRWVVSPRRRTLQRLSETPRTLVQHARGTVRVAGTVRSLGEPLRAPLSERDCVAYELRIEIWDGEDWAERVVRRAAVDFALVDESGEARVQPGRHYEILLPGDCILETEGDEVEPHPTPLRAAIGLLEAQGIGTRTFWFQRLIRFRCFEAILEEGELAAVYGSAVEEVHSEGERPGPRSLPMVRLLRGSAEEPVRIGSGAVASDGLGSLPPGG